MKSLRLFAAPAALAFLVTACPAADKDADGFVPLFNGTDLSGWVNVNCAPGTFFVKGNEIITTGKPTGFLRTDRQYENFVLEVDWMHVNTKEVGNSGIFIWGDPLPAPGTPYTRGIEVQVLVNYETDWATSHGDVFSIWGARCKPDRPHPKGAERCLPGEKRCKGGGEWNHYKIVANNGNIQLHVNGKEVSGVSACNPRKGYLALESEGAECRFRNIRIKELPSTNPTRQETAEVAEDFTSLYTGLDLTHWKADAGHQGHWKSRDWVLAYDGKSTARDQNLWTEKTYGDFEFIVDWRLPATPHKVQRPVILPTGDAAINPETGKPRTVEVDDAGDSGIYLRGSDKSQVNIWCWPVGSGEVYGYRTDKGQPAAVRAAVTPRLKADRPLGQWNRFKIRMRGDRLTVLLNGKTVLEEAQLPGVPPRGPIALQHHGDAIEFANPFIRELK